MSESKKPAAGKGGDVLRLMDRVAISMGLLQNPEDYLIDNGAPAGVLEAYLNSQFSMIVKAAAKATGADEEQLADKTRRTPEQERVMMEISGRYTIARMNKYLDSDYLLANNKLKEAAKEKGYADSEASINPETGVSDLEQAVNYIVRYFFALHTELDPREGGKLEEKHFSELLTLLDKALAIKAGKPHKPYLEAVGEAIGVNLEAARIIKLEQLSSLIPTRHVMPNNKLTNTLTDDIIDTGSYELTVAGKGKNAVTTVCVLTYEGDNVKLTGRQSFTEYDRNVYNAVTSLFVYGDEAHIVTPAQVYRAMVNMTETETPSAQQIGAVTRSLDKMRFIRARVDCTEELRRRGANLDGEQITGGMIDTYLLTADAVTVMTGGKTVKAYRIIKTPILYEYSSLVKQVLTIPAKLLDIQEGGQRVKNTEQRIAIKGYLLRRIEVMKGKTPQSNHILFDAIYTAAGEESPSDMEKKRLREYVFTVLDYWKELGYIKGYSRLRSGTTYTGIDVTPA